MDVEYIRMLNFAVVATAAAWMFVRVNDSITAHDWPVRVMYTAIVGFYLTVAGGSLESYYRGAPMSGSAWLLLVFAVLTNVGLFLTRHNPHLHPSTREKDNPDG